MVKDVNLLSKAGLLLEVATLKIWEQQKDLIKEMRSIQDLYTFENFAHFLIGNIWYYMDISLL